MKTLRKTAEEAYLKYANKIINRETWIDGFISGIQYKKEYPQSIELCGLLWDTENLAIGGYEKDGHHYYTWQEAMDAELRGRWFGGNHNSDHKGSLFLPAAGLRDNSSGELANTSSNGYYWSSSPNYGGNNNAGNLSFYSGNVYPLGNNGRAYGFSVRCVQNK